MTSTTLTIGVIHSTNVDSVDNAVGGGDQDTGSEKAAYEVLIADLNKRGGLAGRRIQAVFHADDASSSQTREEKEQSACASFLDDNQVFAVFASTVTDTLRSCLQRTGVLLISEFYTYSERATLARFPDYYEPGSIPIDRLAAALGDALLGNGYLSPSDTAAGGPGRLPTRVGIVTLDAPAFARGVTAELLPRFRRAGVPAQVVRVPAASRTSDAGATTASVSSAVLRFRNDGVTHVVFLTAAALVPLSFIATAESQGYRPRYAYTSQELMSTALATGAISNPDAQLHGSFGLGYWPVLDVPGGENPYRKNNPRWTGCLRQLAAASRPVTSQQEPFVVMACDRLGFLSSALSGVASPDATAFRTSVSALGSSYQSAFTIAADFSGGARSGPAVARRLEYRPECDCLAYAGADIPIPR